MQAIVKNFRGIREAQITINQIALVAGLNGAGKTSVARAVAAAATGKAIPYAKVTKKDCGVLLRHGTKTAMAGIGNNDGATQIEWPKADVISKGNPPIASEIAAGITDLFSMPPKEALAYLINLLKAEPTLDDLKHTLQEVGLDNADKTADAVWRAIEEKGWDGAHAQAKETGQRLKGAWQHITGTAYGKKKADEWYPEGFEDDVLKEAHESKLLDLRGQLEDAIGKSAVNKAERQRLQELANQLPDNQQEALDAAEKLNEVTAELKAAEKKAQETPNPSANVDYSCPHCEGLVHITALSGSEYTLTKAEKVDQAKLKSARLFHAKLCGEQQRLSTLVTRAQAEVKEAASKENASMVAKENLQKMGAETAEDAPTAVDKIRQQIATIEQRKQMEEKYREATKAAGQIFANQIIIDALDETGLRKIKLGQSLDAFAVEYVESLCKDFGIPSIMIDADLSVSMGEVSYPMLSASEQFRVRTVLQVSIAQLEGSALVIIDGADILDNAGRAKLLSMVIASQIPTLICMTLGKPDKAPDLVAAGVGNTYWIDGGVCQPIHTKDERAAA